MIDEKTLRSYIELLGNERKEWKTVDAKQILLTKELGQRAELIKDIVAMANNFEPSYLIIGLKDKTFEPVGKLLYPLKNHELIDMIKDKVDPKPSVEYGEFNIDGNEYGVIEIIGNNPPYIVSQDLVPTDPNEKKKAVYKGAIFVRSQDTTSGISRDELETLLRNRQPRGFENESQFVQQIVREQVPGWQMKLCAVMLRNKLDSAYTEYQDIKKGLIYSKPIKVTSEDFRQWLSSNLDESASLWETIGTVLTEIVQTWLSNEPAEIKRGVIRFDAVCRELVNFEKELHFLAVDKIWETSKKLYREKTQQVFALLESLVKVMENIIVDFDSFNLDEFASLVNSANLDYEDLKEEVARVLQILNI